MAYGEIKFNTLLGVVGGSVHSFGCNLTCQQKAFMIMTIIYKHGLEIIKIQCKMQMQW